MNKAFVTRFLSGRVAAAILALAVAGASSGCLALAVGAGAAGTVAYVRGELKATVEAGLNETLAATNQAIREMEFAKISESKDSVYGTVVARTANDQKIEIKLTKVAAELTEVRIRVGLFGDEALSVAILDKIKENL